MVTLKDLRGSARVTPKLWEYGKVLDGNAGLVAVHTVYFGRTFLAQRVAFTIHTRVVIPLHACVYRGREEEVGELRRSGEMDGGGADVNASTWLRWSQAHHMKWSPWTVS